MTNRKILLVEDNQTLACALTMRLTAVGYKVRHATTVSSALKDVITHNPDIGLIDINLPDANGFTLAQKLHDHNHYPDIPIIFITANQEASYRAHATQYGPVAYLEKPFDASELIYAIEQSNYSTDQFGAKANFKEHGRHEQLARLGYL